VSPDPIRALVATVVAVVLAVVTRTVAGLVGVEVLVPEGPGSEDLVDLTVVRSVVVVVVVAGAASVVRVVLDRLTPDRAVPIATGPALVVLALSAVPVLDADLEPESAGVLLLLHLAVAVPLVRDVVRG
jgi:hypothetical protein